MIQYQDLLRHVLESGSSKRIAPGPAVILFSAHRPVTLGEGFPLVTTKKVHLKSIIYELLWFLRGDTNIKYLKENGVTIWDEWADKKGTWAGFTALNGATGARRTETRLTKSTVLSSRSKRIPTAGALLFPPGTPGELDQMALPPCHAMFQFYVQEGGLSCQLYQRSADLFLGVPFNIASDALLTLMVAQVGVAARHVRPHLWRPPPLL